MKKQGIVWLTVLLAAEMFAVSASADEPKQPDPVQTEILAVEAPEENETEEKMTAAPQTDDRLVRLGLLCAVSGLGICVTKKRETC